MPRSLPFRLPIKNSINCFIANICFLNVYFRKSCSGKLQKRYCHPVSMVLGKFGNWLTLIKVPFSNFLPFLGKHMKLKDSVGNTSFTGGSFLHFLVSRQDVDLLQHYYSITEFSESWVLKFYIRRYNIYKSALLFSVFCPSWQHYNLLKVQISFLLQYMVGSRSVKMNQTVILGPHWM